MWKLKKKIKFGKTNGKILFLFGIIFVFLLLINLVSAYTIQQYSKVFLNPFYFSSAINNTDINFVLDISSLNQASSISSAIINFQILLNPTVTFDLLVDGQSCNNPSYTVSSDFSGIGQSNIFFDCSNIITHSGVYNLTLRTDKNVGSIIGYVDLFYSDILLGSLNLYGTEYTYGQTAKVWLQLLNSNNQAVTNGVCFLDIYKPDNSKLLDSQIMTNIFSNGIYVYDFTVPSVEGVYPCIAKCYYNATQNIRNATDYFITSGVFDGGSLSDTYILDGTYFKIKTDKNGGLTPINRINVTFNFSDFYSNCGNINENLLSGITFYWNGKWDTGTIGHDINIYIFNYTSNSWKNFSNKILGGNGGTQFIVSNSVDLINITKSLGIDNVNLLKIKLEDNYYDEGAKRLSIDYMYASCNQLANQYWQEVKGSSEIHISEPILINLTEISNAVWNNTDRSLTEFNFIVNTTLNLTQVASAVWNYEGDRNLTFYLVNNITPEDIWGFANRTLTSDSIDYNLIQKMVWNSTDRNLTFYQDIFNYTRIDNTIFSINDSISNQISLSTLYLFNEMQNIPNNTWNFSGNRTLTYYEVTQINATEIAIQVWQSDNRSLTYYLINNITAQDIWEYSNRSLTDVTNIASAIWSWTGGISSSILSLFSDTIWSAVNRTLTAFDFTVNAEVNYSKIAEYTWSYENRSLTFYVINNVSVEDIWQYASRNLTFTEDTTNYSMIAEYVWLYVDRNLTTYPVNNITVEDIWNYYNRSLTQDIPMEIWSYPNRNLTQDIPFDVWSYENRTLTYYAFNLTDLLNMVNNNTDIHIPFVTPTGNNNQFISYTLNVTMVSPS